MVRTLDPGMTEPLVDELRDNGATFNGATYAVGLELAQIGGAVWTPATDYQVGDLVRATADPMPGTPEPPPAATGRLYQCVVAGQSDASNEPLWPTTFGEAVADGDTLVWEDITPTVAWYVQAVGQVAVTNYHRLPPGSAYRQRYVVTDGAGGRGPFPNAGAANTWRMSAGLTG